MPRVTFVVCHVST